MRALPLVLTLMVALLAACGESEPSAPPPQGPELFVAGTIELTGRLADSQAAGLQIVGSSPGMATPLVKKVELRNGRRTAQGTLVVPFSLGAHDGMLASRTIPREVLPEEIELKISYSTDGLVENIQREHDWIRAVRVGDLRMEIRMEPGEAPASRPTSRPTSRPVRKSEF